MPEGRAARRNQLLELWSKHYPRPLAHLISVIFHPFEDDDQSLGESGQLAWRTARQHVRALFPSGDTRPSGGEVEAPLRGIAVELLDALGRESNQESAAQRLALAIEFLGEIDPVADNVETEDLVVPESARRLDGAIPFAMWR